MLRRIIGFAFRAECKACKGKGVVNNVGCQPCNGSGQVGD